MSYQPQQPSVATQQEPITEQNTSTSPGSMAAPHNPKSPLKKIVWIVVIVALLAVLLFAAFVVYIALGFMGFYGSIRSCSNGRTQLFSQTQTITDDFNAVHLFTNQPDVKASVSKQEGDCVDSLPTIFASK